MASEEGTAHSQLEDGMLHQPTGLGDFVAGIACLVLALIGAFVVVPVWVYVPEKVAGTVDSPAVMPLLMLGLIGLLGALLLFKIWLSGDTRQTHRSVQDWSRAAGMMAICAGYLILIFVVGLPIATGLSLAAAMNYFGERRWVIVVPVAILTPLILWSFFAYVAQVPMPRPLIELVGIAHAHQHSAGSASFTHQVPA